MNSDTSLTTAARRPPALDYLIADFGKYTGLEGLTFDDDNQLQLVLAGVELLIEYLGQSEAILIQCMIGTVSEEKEVALYAWLNAMNGVSFRVGAGVLCLVPPSHAVLWSDRFLWTSLTLENIYDVLKEAAESALLWQQALVEFLAPSSVASQVPDPRNGASFMIKI